jgi:Zn-dependent M28 family amino/carboxypeptidase
MKAALKVALTLVPLLAPGALFAQSASSQTAPAEAIPASPIDPAKLSAHIKVLADDSFEGRGPGTPGEVKSIAYIESQMQAEGFQPAGDKGKDGKRAWTQDVPLSRFELKGPIKLSLHYGAETKPLTQGEEIVVRSQRPVKHIALKDAPLVFVGYGVKAPERQWDDFKGVNLKGKIMVVLVNDPDFETPPGHPTTGKFGGKAMTYYGRWTYKYEEAARQHAAGVLIVHETAPAAYGWNVVKSSNIIPSFDVVQSKPDEAHTKVEGWIQRDVAVDLFKRCGLDFAAEKAKAQTAAFKPVALNCAKFSADFDVDAKTVVTHNVAGVLPGKTHPDEYVVYSAHWDHLGIGPADAKGDKIYNGAIDNADGIASILEIGRVLAAGPRPERSILLLAVTAEEKGLLGSEYYASHPLYPLAKTVAVLNIDALGAYGPARDIGTSGDGKIELQDMLAAAAKAEGRRFTPDPTPEAGHFFRSDHFPFAKRGVPAISIDSGLDLYKGGEAAGRAAAEDYVQHRYHQPSDEWKTDWDLTGMAIDDGLVLKLGRDLANSRKWPEWQAGSEFKAVRDATAAQRK